MALWSFMPNMLDDSDVFSAWAAATTAEEVLPYEPRRTRRGRGQLGPKTGLKAGPVCEWEPQQAHPGWLHYDIGWRLGDVYGLHLPPLFFNGLSCTKKRQINISATVPRNMCYRNTTRSKFRSALLHQTWFFCSEMPEKRTDVVTSVFLQWCVIVGVFL